MYFKSRSFGKPRTCGPRLFFVVALTFATIALMGSDARAQLALGIGGPLSDEGRALAIDAAGNTYLTGSFRGTVDFDPSPGAEFELTALPAEKWAFVASYDAAGAFRYALGFKGEGLGIGVDNDGNVFVTGEIGSGGVDVDPGPDVILLDWTDGRVFVVSYDSNGSLRFGFNVGGGITNLVEKGKAIALDGAGNCYVTGMINGVADMDPSETGEEIITVYGNTDGFLASYDNSGGLRFAFPIGGRFTDTGGGIAVDATGNSYVTGAFRDTVDLHPGPEEELWVSNGNQDLFLASYSSLGDFRFALAVGGTHDDQGLAVAIDNAGNSFVTGSFNNEVDFDPGPGENLLSASINENFFLASYSDLGDMRFAFGLGTDHPMKGYGVAVDDLGSPYVIGDFSDDVDFDPGPGNFTLSGGQDAFVAGYTNAGDFVFAYNFPNIGIATSDSGQGIVLDSMRRPHVIGTFSATIDVDIGPGVIPLTSNGSDDVFLTRFVPVPSAVEEVGPAGPGCTLSAGYPNPTSSQMRFNLSVQQAGHISVAVYDLAGRLVSRLHDGLLPDGAQRTLMFAGDSLPSGQYFVRVNDQRGSRVQRLVIVR